MGNRARGLQRVTTSYDERDRPVAVRSADGTTSATTSSTYQPDTGLLASQTDPDAGTVRAGYDANGALIAQTVTGPLGAGLAMRQEFDPTGAPTERVWTLAGLAEPLLAETAHADVHVQVRDATLPVGQRAYSYDRAGRLTATAELAAGSCALRGYRYDRHSNRIGASATTAAPTADGGCLVPGVPVGGHGYDSADRLVDPGHRYDAFGRTTTAPTRGGVMTLEHAATDLVASQRVYADAAAAAAGRNPLQTQTYTLDPTGQRIGDFTITTADPAGGPAVSVRKENRYASEADAPVWIEDAADPAGTLTRHVTGPAGELLATLARAKDGAVSPALTWQLTTLHGDVAATLPPTTRRR